MESSQHTRTPSHPAVGAATAWDVIVVGGGAAGLSGALTLARAQRRVLVLDAAAPRNRFASHMHGVLGHEGLSPLDLLVKGRAEVESFGGEIRTADVVAIAPRDADDLFTLTTAAGETFQARTVLVTTGLVDELPAIPGLRERWGRDVFGCPYCHGAEVAGQRIGVIAASPFGVHHAQLLRQWSDQVTFFSALAGPLDEDIPEGFKARGVRVVSDAVEQVEIVDDAVRAVIAGGQRYEVDAVVSGADFRPRDEVLRALGVTFVEGPMGISVAAAPGGKTNVAGLYAAGNVVNLGASVPIVMGEATMAAALLNAELVQADFALARKATGAYTAHWEERYNEEGRIWSGQVNRVLATEAALLRPGRALDLGCGEGGDALWLAARGWQVTAVDVSPTALQRARDEATSQGISGIDFVQADLATWIPQGEFDLVSAQFLHSRMAFPREQVLARAAKAVAPGGRMLIVSHAAPPPGSRLEQHAHDSHGEPVHFPTAEEELAALNLPAMGWVVEYAETRSRIASGGPHHGDMTDTVVLVRRLS